MPAGLPSIHYSFNDPALLVTALTHSSYANERGLGRQACNERLEFLGDSVLGYITAEYLYKNYPGKTEGELTRMRSVLVCEANLAAAARQLELGKHLLVGKGEEQSGGRNRASILADAYEAAVAAIYLDGGQFHAERFVCESILSDPDTVFSRVADYKTRLQEIVQVDGAPLPEYRIINERGPEHAKIFTAQAIIRGKVFGTGEGATKKDAEQAAAKSALENLPKA